MRNTIRNWMLGAAMAAGLFGAGAMTANAAPRYFHGPVYGGYARPGFGVVVGAPVVPVAPVVEGYIPPCPGDGYVWLGGAWVFRGYGPRYGYGPVARFDHRGFDGRGYARGFRR